MHPLCLRAPSDPFNWTVIRYVEVSGVVNPVTIVIDGRFAQKSARLSLLAY
jgi:hypothetical protein